MQCEKILLDIDNYYPKLRLIIQMKNCLRSVFKRSWLFFIVFLLLSCTTKVEKLSISAQDRWDNLIKRNWDEAYQYETPEYRGTYDAYAFRGNFGGAAEWISAKVMDISHLQEDVADVMVELEVVAENIQITHTVTDRWIYKKGEWWHVQDE